MKRLVWQSWFISLVFIIFLLGLRFEGYSAAIIVARPYSEYLFIMPLVVMNIIFGIILFFKAKAKSNIDWIFKIVSVVMIIGLSIGVFYSPLIYILCSTSLQIMLQCIAGLMSIVLTLFYYIPKHKTTD